ncbi:MAG: O-methyltransferase [Bryobacterales bacterium]|nr:O-methyltransferase [Bryobacterales bacterium]
MPSLRFLSCTIFLFSIALPVCAQRGNRDPGTLPLANSEAEKRILAVLDEARQSGKLYLSVPIADGRMLRLLAEAVNAKTVVEIGTSTGYSGLWFCLALESTGGKLTTFEFDKERAAAARKHFEQAGVATMVTLIEGDAHENVKRIKGPVDVVFIDADKEGYVDYLEKVLPLVRPGGLILAHNTQLREVREGYLKRVQSDPALETMIFNDGGGLGITVKKR